MKHLLWCLQDRDPKAPSSSLGVLFCCVAATFFFFFILFCVLETKKSITGEPLMVFWALQRHFFLRQRDVFQSDACQGAQLENSTFVPNRKPRTTAQTPSLVPLSHRGRIFFFFPQMQLNIFRAHERYQFKVKDFLRRMYS